MLSVPVRQDLVVLLRPDSSLPSGEEPIPDPALEAEAAGATILKPAIRYKSGTNTRTGERSPYKTRAGEEKTALDKVPPAVRAAILQAAGGAKI